MTDLSTITGTWVIDPSHSRLGFETRHAVITKVRGHFADFEGTGELSRKDFGLTWNVALETGGFLVSDNIKLQLDISAIKQ